jgi:hypothetical protein
MSSLINLIELPCIRFSVEHVERLMCEVVRATSHYPEEVGSRYQKKMSA